MLFRSLDENNRGSWYKWIYHKFYFDELYYSFVRQFLFKGVAAAIRLIEDVIVAGTVKVVTYSIQKAGNLVREAHSGFTPFYLGSLIVGVLLWRFLGNLPV